MAASALASGTLAPSFNVVAAAETGTETGQEVTAWTVAPSDAAGRASGRPWLVYTVDPGDRLVDHLAVTNTGTTDLDLRVAPAGASITADGVFTVDDGGSPDASVAGWFSPARPWLRLDPGQTRVVQIDVHVPRTAEPGDVVGALVLAQASDVRIGGRPVRLRSRVAVRAYVRVNGDAPAGIATGPVAVERLRGNWWSPFDDVLRLHYTVRNTGRVRVTTDASAQATGALGWDLGSVPASQPTALPPDGRADAVLDVPLTFTGGPVDVRAVVGAVDSVTGRRVEGVVLTSQVVVVPVAPALLGAAILMAVLALQVRRRRSGR